MKESEKRKTSRKGVRVLNLFLFLLFVMLLLSLFADRIAAFLLFHPWKPNADWQPTTPNSESVRFPTADGSLLDAIYFPCEHPKGIVLYSHGNGDTLKNLEPIADFYRKEFQISILIYDYRGYGRSGGKPTASGILEDGRAARKWLARREQIDMSEIIQMGFSLGGAVAVDLASQDGAKGLILQSTFTSLPDMASRMFPFLPARLLLHQQLDSVKKIRQYKGPLLLSHGSADGTVPYQQGQKLYLTAGGSKTLYTVENGSHFPPGDREYFDLVRRFLRDLGNIP